MSEKMQVVFVKTTGHVLAASTRTTDPEGKLKVEDLTGGLLTRNRKIVRSGGGGGGGEVLIVPPENLDVSVVKFNADVLLSPSDFAVAGETAEQLGDASLSPTVALTVDKLTITLPNAAPADMNVWAQLEKVITQSDPEPVRRVIEGKVLKTGVKAHLALTTHPGGLATPIPVGADYRVLTLVEGRRPVFNTLNLPAVIENP